MNLAYAVALSGVGCTRRRRQPHCTSGLGKRLMEVQEWRIAGASAIGTSHLKSSAPCQDAFKCGLYESAHEGEVMLLMASDGAMVVREGPEDWCYIFWPQHGEYINTTRFLTDPSSIDQLEFTLVARAIHELAVFTDGIEPLVLQYATNTVHSPFFNTMLPPVRALAERAEEAGPGDGMRPGDAERTGGKMADNSNPTRRAAVSDVATGSIAAGLLPPSQTVPPGVAQSVRMQRSPRPARQIWRRQRNRQLAVYRRPVAT